MDRQWLTIASPTTEAMVNPLLAACEGGYVPDSIQIVSNPTVEDAIEPVVPFLKTAVTEYDGNATIDVHTLTDETAFAEIVEFFRNGIQHSTDELVAVDITPGRKFMSAIAFQAGIHYGADHVFYLLLDSSAFYGQVYPDIPRPAVDLIDFTEVV
ncbi:hypothetical protein ACFQO4_18370 [Saliphagus sp. GCM10025334]